MYMPDLSPIADVRADETASTPGSWLDPGFAERGKHVKNERRKEDGESAEERSEEVFCSHLGG